MRNGRFFAAMMALAMLGPSCALDQIEAMRKAVEEQGRKKFSRAEIIDECTKLENQYAGLAPGKFDFSAYPALMELLRKGQTSLASAHTQAGLRLIARARRVSKKRGFHEHVDLLDRFRVTWLSFAKKADSERDLPLELKDLVAALSYYSFDTDVCSNPSLRGFYFLTMAYVDPFGEVLSGGEEEAGKALLKPDTDDSKKDGLRLQRDASLGEWIRIVVRNAEDARLMERLAEEHRKEQELAAESGKARLPVWVDLSSAHGLELGALAPLAKELVQNPEIPVVVKVDSSTRGAPESFAAELSKYPNVFVVGAPTLGARNGVCSKEIRFAPDASPVRVAIRCGDAGGDRSGPVLPDRKTEDEDKDSVLKKIRSQKKFAWILRKIACVRRPRSENARLGLEGRERPNSELDERKRRMKESLKVTSEAEILKAWKDAGFERSSG